MTPLPLRLTTMSRFRRTTLRLPMQTSSRLSSIRGASGILHFERNRQDVVFVTKCGLTWVSWAGGAGHPVWAHPGGKLPRHQGESQLTRHQGRIQLPQHQGRIQLPRIKVRSNYPHIKVLLIRHNHLHIVQLVVGKLGPRAKLALNCRCKDANLIERSYYTRAFVW